MARSDAIGRALSGKAVNLNAGKDIMVLGSAIGGEGDVSLVAAGNIAAATSTLTEHYHSEGKERGFLSGGGLGSSDARAHYPWMDKLQAASPALLRRWQCG
ncbi:hemagglutinin repeat-containing protein [Massilia sp. PWRC2]|uniref:hemagglutinin repeat-containing protein n=1 Tax=Massilia sp. PWRC2 TaxID=2804626 RepID=UPI003CF59003